MIVSFFGHADFLSNSLLREKILTALENFYKKDKIDFYLGAYGRFDSFALSICKEFKKTHNDCNLYFITPYLGSYLDSRKSYLCNIYDDIIYPPLENELKRLAIIKRNEWIINKSDFIFFYVYRNYGGAYLALNYAKRKRKNLLNIYEFEK